MASIKGISQPQSKLDGSPLRVAIVHARWNKAVIDALVAGAITKLKESGVKESNIVVESVPGSFELPLACSKVIAGSHIQVASNETDLLGGLNFGGTTSPKPTSRASTPAPFAIPGANQPFDAVIAIGVLIKGSTMHFDGVPVIFGVLTALTDDQALERAGIGRGEKKGHNHGEDWGLAAVEMGSHVRRWGQGKFSS
ncbi:lumazine synthase [Paramarasmius palmivorus]|uniref:6,7-dimethyl-8-ribityllumazine synthase n=1 Tax=Paramarasmius palmivorus TaxID=297713 RepID=A0AAW0CQK4_9AGAR